MDEQHTLQDRNRRHDTVGRRTWHALSAEEKQERLAGLRRRQQRQVEVELRMLP